MGSVLGEVLSLATEWELSVARCVLIVVVGLGIGELLLVQSMYGFRGSEDEMLKRNYFKGSILTFFNKELGYEDLVLVYKTVSYTSVSLVVLSYMLSIGVDSSVVHKVDDIVLYNLIIILCYSSVGLYYFSKLNKG